MTPQEYTERFWTDAPQALHLLVEELLQYYPSYSQLAEQLVLMSRRLYPDSSETFSSQSVKAWIRWLLDKEGKKGSGRKPGLVNGLLFFRTLLEMKVRHERELVELDAQ